MSDVPHASDPLADLAALPDPQERLSWIVDRGRHAPTLNHEERIPANRVPGCTSAVWLVDACASGIAHFRADAEAPVLRGLARLIVERANGRPTREVAADRTDVIATLGLERHLTPTRVQGLRQLQAHIRACSAGATGTPS